MKKFIIIGSAVIAAVTTAVVVIVTLTATAVAAQNDQHQNDDSDEYPIVVKAIAQAHFQLSPPCFALLHTMPEVSLCYKSVKSNTLAPTKSETAMLTAR